MQRHEVLEKDIARGTSQRCNFEGEQASEKAEILILFQSMSWKPQLPSNRWSPVLPASGIWNPRLMCIFLQLTKLWQRLLGSLPTHLIWNPLFCLCVPTFKSLMRVSRSLICSRVWVLAWTFCSWDFMSWSSSPIVLKSFSSVITQLSQAGENSGNQYISLIFNTENVSLNTSVTVEKLWSLSPGAAWRTKTTTKPALLRKVT